jgi:hypothetical protein
MVFVLPAEFHALVREELSVAQLDLGPRPVIFEAKSYKHLKALYLKGYISGCHTLKYLILGCECLLGCVHQSIGFFENFKDFSGNYSIYARARSIFFTWKALNFFCESQIFYWNPRDPNYLPSFPRNFWDSSGYIFRGLKYLSELFLIYFKLENVFWKIFLF